MHQEINSRRDIAIDATRGLAMLLVFIAHFGWILSKKGGSTNLLFLTTNIGLFASPIFMMLSGCMLGYYYQRKKDDVPGFQRKFIDRGFFLLTIGHFLIMLAHVRLSGNIADAFRWGFITDAIGVSMICGALLVPVISAARRLVLGVVLFAAASILSIFWWPASPFGIFMKETLIGSSIAEYYVYNFPLMPWFALYIAGSGLGERISVYARDGKKKEIGSLLRGALLCLLLFLAVKLIMKLLVLQGYISTNDMLYIFLAKQSQKLPPTIGYFLYHGSIGVMILLTFMQYRDNDMVKKMLQALAFIGQASLAVFIVQYYVYYTIFYSIHAGDAVYWVAPLYFILSVALLWWFSIVWVRLGWNKYLSVLYPITCLQHNGTVGFRKPK